MPLNEDNKPPIVRNNTEVWIDCNELCPIDCKEEKIIGECNNYDNCGDIKIKDGDYISYTNDARYKYLRRKINWKELVQKQGNGKNCDHTTGFKNNINDVYQNCDILCPIDCEYDAEIYQNL